MPKPFPMTNKGKLYLFLRSERMNNRGYTAKELYVKFPNASQSSVRAAHNEWAKSGLLTTQGERGGKEFRWAIQRV